MSNRATRIVVVKILVMAATSNVVTKHFATTLIPTTCNDIFSLKKVHFTTTLYFAQRHMSVLKTIFLVVLMFNWFYNLVA